MDTVRQLQQEVLSLQGIKRPKEEQRSLTFGQLETAFYGKTFPVGFMHEFISSKPESAAATTGFMTGLLSKITGPKGMCIWISTRRTIYPAALKLFGMAPDQVVFIDLTRHKDALWTIEEALKCEAVGAVVGEINELSFTESRRLQLAVEKSRVTGFIHRYRPRSENTVACIAKWKISPVQSITDGGMPGLGYPRWNVQLVKVRNGRPGSWDIEWSDNTFRYITRQVFTISGSPKNKIA